MFRLFKIVGLTLSLGACVPLAMFASSTPGYQNRLGVQVANGDVNTLCMSPALRLAIWEFEGKFGKKIVVTSGYRTPWRNASVGGASRSLHTKCMAADFFIPGVPKSELIAFAKSLRAVGGLGCYYGRPFIHVDVRSRPQGYRQPVTWNC